LDQAGDGQCYAIYFGRISLRDEAHSVPISSVVRSVRTDTRDGSKRAVQVVSRSHPFDQLDATGRNHCCSLTTKLVYPAIVWHPVLALPSTGELPGRRIGVAHTTYSRKRSKVSSIPGYEQTIESLAIKCEVLTELRDVTLKRGFIT
jgi:hypothetical protein